MRMKRSSSIALIVLAGFLGACSDDDSGEPPRDSGKPDATTPADGGSDGGMDASIDATIGDAAIDLDAASSDGSRPDGSLSDGSRPDGSQSDGSQPDGSQPDGSQPDAAAPDSGVVACSAASAPTLPKLAIAPVAGAELTRLVFAAQPKGSSDWYLVSQNGTIRVLSGGTLAATPLVDVSTRIGTLGDNDERGLLGLAFPPDYATSGLFYIALTPVAGDDEDLNRDLVLEYQRPTNAGDAATFVREIVALPASDTNHNGGHIAFGPDGFLYVGTGDGGGACNNNQSGAPQDVSTLFGKILRLDPSAAAPYAAAGNPFASGGDARVLHYGLRNPFRFAFDRQTGDLYVGDVGQASYEEVDFAARGASGLNFGWVKHEGNHADTCGASNLRAGSVHTPPVIDIDRRGGATGPFADYISVIAGPVYRGAGIPSLRGVALFGDFTGRRLGAFVQCGSQTSPVAPILKNVDINAPTSAALARPDGFDAFSALTAIVEDDAGELYFVHNRSRLVKLVPGT